MNDSHLQNISNDTSIQEETLRELQSYTLSSLAPDTPDTLVYLEIVVLRQLLREIVDEVRFCDEIEIEEISA